MDQRIQAYRKRGLNNLQINEVIEGFRNGLSTEEVDKYATGEYSHLQMRQIRLGLQEGLTDDQIAAFKRPEIKADVMEHIRIKTMTGNVIDESKKADLHRKKIRNVVLVLLIPFLLIGGTLVFFVTERYLSARNQNLEIILTSNKVEIGYGETFNAMDYVKSYTRSPITELTLPENIETDTIGEYKLIYKLSNPLKSIDAELYVDVVDKKAPVIKLKQQSATLTRDKDKLDPKSYIESVQDEYDGDLSESVQIEPGDDSSENQEIRYKVQDSSGNASEEFLTVNWIKPTPPPTPVPTPKPTASSNSNNNSSSNKQSSGNKKNTNSSGSSSTAPSAAPKKNEKGSKSFMFSDGYNLDSGFSACNAAGKSHRKYSCQPLTNSDGIYIGYRLDWED